MNGERAGRNVTTALLALGIVYGDLGTSPLYAVHAIALGMGDRLTAEAALGALSLIIWALIVVVSLKYCWFAMRVDNQGEGGILALLMVTGARWGRPGQSLVAMGLFGAALLYGDGVITPGISVLSAVEGLNVVTDIFAPYTVVIAVAILVALFAVQKRGIGSVGRTFGPIMLIWFVTIAMLGVLNIWRHPQVLYAINPIYGLNLLVTHSGAGMATLGGVFLALTGAEALYADMGQIGRRPIRVAWYYLVFPALLLNYAGQISYILEHGHAGNPFFQMAAAWMVYPLVVLATLASIIASQAIISGCFSMTLQATQLGWLPAIKVHHTSADHYGQIYVPFVNWTMMAVTVLLVLIFGSAEKLASAYGTAVSVTMVFTTVLLHSAMRMQGHYLRPVELTLLVGAFLFVDFSFLAACLLKIDQGGWIPLMIGGLLFGTMVTWYSGAADLQRQNEARSRIPAQFLEALHGGKTVCVPGTAIFLTRSSENMPSVVIDYMQQTGSLQTTVVLLAVDFERVPRLVPADRVQVVRLTDEFWRITVRFGFREEPDLPSVLLAATKASELNVADASYFIQRHDVIARTSCALLHRWRTALFALMLRNSGRAIDQFKVPPSRLVELGRRIEL